VQLHPNTDGHIPADPLGITLSEKSWLMIKLVELRQLVTNRKKASLKTHIRK